MTDTLPPHGARLTLIRMMKSPRALLLLSCLIGLCLPMHRACLAQTYSVDGMIGQVNGRAIYTHDVLDEQLCELLAGWGRELPRNEFSKRAAERIAVRLNGMVTDALIYGEAQRDLSDQERQGLAIAITRQREQLLREHGQGSPALAEAELIRKTDMDLDQTLERWRQALVVQRYMRQKLTPLVNVTRKDIKRYYKDHIDEFNPPASRTVRVIQTQTGDDAQYILGLLETGTPFADAAADPRNLFRPDSAGLMGDMAGDQLFADPTVNQATLDLEPGQSAGPFTIGERDWLVCVDQIDQQPGRPLMDVQVQIQAMLTEQQLREYTERYRLKLFENGSYNSIEQMTLSLVEIAVDRYARDRR
jgi:PPIC-type PPIASE domain